MRVWLKHALIPILYRRPVPELGPDRLYLFLDVLVRTRALPGAVVEIGCFQCGTAAWAYRMLKALDVDRPYLCVDTFDGFVPSQFSADVMVGTASTHRRGFSGNSMAFVRRLLDRWQVPQIALMRGDVASVSPASLPEQIAAALVDVDLEQPTYAALEKIYPRLVSGGVILVDDCSDEVSNSFRGARIGYRRFVSDRGLPEQYRFGMGAIEKS